MKNYQKCLYGNLVSINFRKTAVLKKQTNKQTIANLSFTAKDCGYKSWGAHLCRISPVACFRFSIHLSVSSLEILVCRPSDKGVGGGGGGGVGSPKNFFRPFGHQFRLKIGGGSTTAFNNVTKCPSI